MTFRRSRRRFLLLGGGALGAGVLVIAVRVRRAHRTQGDPGPILAAGPLVEDEEKALGLVCEALITYPIETGHYVEYLGWRAKHLFGYRNLYLGLLADLDERARIARGRAFSACDLSGRREVLGQALAPAQALDPARVAQFQQLAWEEVLARPATDEAARALRYHRFVRSEVFAIFSTNEAMLALGYDAAIGVPRGLVDYQQPPRIAQ